MTRQQAAAAARPRCSCGAFAAPSCRKCRRSPDDVVATLRALVARRRTLGQLTVEQATFADELLLDLGVQ